MEFYLGLLTAAVFFIAFIFTFYMGYRFGKQKKPTKQNVDEEIVRRQKQIQEGFLKTMNYDVTQALQRKKVT